MRDLKLPPISTTSDKGNGTCAETYNYKWFDYGGLRGTRKDLRMLIAQSICSTCPMLRACIDQQFNIGNPDAGLYGALDKKQRVSYLQNLLKNNMAWDDVDEDEFKQYIDLIIEEQYKKLSKDDKKMLLKLYLAYYAEYYMNVPKDEKPKSFQNIWDSLSADDRLYFLIWLDETYDANYEKLPTPQ